jgi:hypothetical protein
MIFRHAGGPPCHNFMWRFGSTMASTPSPIIIIAVHSASRRVNIVISLFVVLTTGLPQEDPRHIRETPNRLWARQESGRPCTHGCSPPQHSSPCDRNNSTAIGTVEINPTATSVHPTALRCSGLRRSDNNSATPAPSAARVPATMAISGTDRGIRFTRCSL